MTTQPGTRIGDYLVGEPLGSGGAGTVHRATHVGSGQEVAIKVAAPRAAGSTTDLRREAEVLARAAHPNVVGLVEVVEDGADTWVVQELVDGPTLEDVLVAHGSLTPEQSLGVLRGALTGLAHVHTLGLVHGDLSPRNVVFDRAGTAKLADFGSARGTGESGATATPAFSSPEAVRGAGVGPAADVYSAAAVLHLLLTGRPVFPHRDAAAVLRAHVSEPAPALTGHGPHLAALLDRALAKDPAARPADGAAFLAELEEAAQRTYGPGWLGRSALTAVVGARVQR
ncbi:serine/threonine-protein kinase [Klenkia terrae]|uniref:serine/threonine-protein kinase n=1 Tax=Klenkia terrae TaxID=1052259 RepID=UPI00361A35A4